MQILDLTNRSETTITNGIITQEAQLQGIDLYADYECILPTSCTQIDSQCFFSTSLKSILNINKVTEIGYAAFSNTNLEGIIWIDHCTSLGQNCFMDCQLIEKVVLSPSLTQVPNMCFCGCSNLKKVVNLNKVTTIGNSAFNSTGLEGEIWLDCCTSLGESSFVSCSSITKVVLSPSLETIESECFCDCSALKKVVNLHKVTSIGNSAFCRSALEGEIWLDCCTSLGESSFISCTSITKVVLSPSLTQVPKTCFNCCSNLKKVVNLNKVTTIGDDSFGMCALEGEIWLDCCTSLGTYTFENCEYITKVVLSPSLGTIGFNCFYTCLALNRVVNLNKVTTIDDGAFQSSGLGGEIWLDCCTSLGQESFAGCSSITKVVLSPSLTRIPTGCFIHCMNLKKVVNLNKVTDIFDETFKGDGLEGEIWLDHCTTLGSDTFKNCSNLTIAYVNSSLTDEVISNAFDNTCAIVKI